MKQVINSREKPKLQDMEVASYINEDVIVMVESVYVGEKNIQDILAEYLQSRIPAKQGG